MDKKCCSINVTELENGYRFEITGDDLKEKCTNHVQGFKVICARHVISSNSMIDRYQVQLRQLERRDDRLAHQLGFSVQAVTRFAMTEGAEDESEFKVTTRDGWLTVAIVIPDLGNLSGGANQQHTLCGLPCDIQCRLWNKFTMTHTCRPEWYLFTNLSEGHADVLFLGIIYRMQIKRMTDH